VQEKDYFANDVLELFRWLIDLSFLQILEEKKLKESTYFIVPKTLRKGCILKTMG